MCLQNGADSIPHALLPYRLCDSPPILIGNSSRHLSSVGSGSFKRKRLLKWKERMILERMDFERARFRETYTDRQIDEEREREREIERVCVCVCVL